MPLGLTIYASVAQIGVFLEGRTLPRNLPLIHVSGARPSDAVALHLLLSFDQVVDLCVSTETNRSFKNVKFVDTDGKLATRGLPLDSRVEIVSDTGKPLAVGETGLGRVTTTIWPKPTSTIPRRLPSPSAMGVSIPETWFSLALGASCRLLVAPTTS